MYCLASELLKVCDQDEWDVTLGHLTSAGCKEHNSLAMSLKATLTGQQIKYLKIALQCLGRIGMIMFN